MESHRLQIIHVLNETDCSLNRGKVLLCVDDNESKCLNEGHIQSNRRWENKKVPG